jgi:hypothetical protein
MYVCCLGGLDLVFEMSLDEPSDFCFRVLGGIFYGIERKQNLKSFFFFFKRYKSLIFFINRFGFKQELLGQFSSTVEQKLQH